MCSVFLFEKIRVLRLKTFVFLLYLTYFLIKKICGTNYLLKWIVKILYYQLANKLFLQKALNEL